jgi:hypothetical protein
MKAARQESNKHVQLEGQFRSLVHILCVWQELQWSSWSPSCLRPSSWPHAGWCRIASDSHISYIYIYATAIFIFDFITAQTYGHNFGPDALARKQCRSRVFAALGRALGARRGATRSRSAAPQRARQVRANHVRPCTCGRWDATAPALEARQRCKQARWKRP